MKKIVILILMFVSITSGCTFNKHIKLSPNELFELAEARMKKKNYPKAREMFTRVRDEYPETAQAHLAQLRIGDSYYESKSYSSAAVEYQMFTEFNPASRWAPYAQYQLALSKYYDVETIDRDQQITRDGVEAFNKLIMLYPDAQEIADAKIKLRELERRIVEHHMYVVDFYLRRSMWHSTLDRLNLILGQSKDEDILIDASYKLGKCHIKLNEYEKGRSLLETALPKLTDAKKIEDAKLLLASIPKETPTPTNTPAPKDESKTK